MANDMAIELFSYPRDQLIGMKMSSLFTDTHREKQESLMEQHIEGSGAVVMVCGKVVSSGNYQKVIVNRWSSKYKLL